MGQETWSNKRWIDEQLARGIELPSTTDISSTTINTTTLVSTATASVGSLVISNTASIATTNDTTDSVLTINNTTGKVNKKSGDLYKEVILQRADILALSDAAQFALLPAPGSNKYYDLKKIIMEYKYVGDVYLGSSSADIWVATDFNWYPYSRVKFSLLTDSVSKVALLNTNALVVYDDQATTFNYPYSYDLKLNEGVGIWIENGPFTANSVSTTGTLKVKMWYSIETI